MPLLTYQVLIVLLHILRLSRAHLEVERANQKAVLLSQVKTLTFSAKNHTNSFRTPAIPQLTCDGPGCRLYRVQNMCCKNLGASAGKNKEAIEWACSATVPDGFKLECTGVSCEGYRHKDDPFILRGSCGVKYRLLLTEAGEAKYGRAAKPIEARDMGRMGMTWVDWFLRLCFVVVGLLSILNWIFRGSQQPRDEELQRLGRFHSAYRVPYSSSPVRDSSRRASYKSSSSSSSSLTVCSPSTGFGLTSRR
ncbi:hypothetical protein GLAREA_04798 [Glarea lozoyensis ATCC 20868]|uniref:Store-operated calcium entry-associated regulatory factor n=1 Tax=Glarea lozoyensis (strain ATCC 20868 / MF5171) TaxID=1116229 RepID=S3CNE0_GLAL2|nr:uncharacterized protein GLAREA_04798 [Glarea lozoyensis ATCC 20868]EPE28007.1 hypothetical protein GLAREA_04798 [Glarea lozoyensis ATCC 20868]